MKRDKWFNFWGVLVTPWAAGCRGWVSVYILILIGIILTVVYSTGPVNIEMLWLLAMSPAFYLMHWIVSWLVDRRAGKLPDKPHLRTDCMIIHGVLQSPGIAHLGNGELILLPLVGKAVSIPFVDLEQRRERRWYNGQGYWGGSIFFELPADKQGRRLGFGVACANMWREALHVTSKCI